MSSDRFAAELGTSKRVRCTLVGASCIAALTGGVLIIALPVAPAWSVACLVLWTALSGLELKASLEGMARIERLRLGADGQLVGLSPDGAAEALTLLSGSMVLARFAWLRVRFADGSRYGELLLAADRPADEWRRLQLIWRQRSSAFGRPQ